MSLSLSRVTSVWAYSLAELQPVPQEKLSVLLQACSSDSTEGKDAGSILQKLLPLTMFLEKAHDKVRQVYTPLFGVGGGGRAGGAYVPLQTRGSSKSMCWL